MSPRPFLSVGLASAALFVAACGDTEEGHDDEHGHGHHDHDNTAAKAHHDDDHGHADHGHAAPTAAGPAEGAPAPPAFALGGAQGALVATAEGLRLTVRDAAGAPVAPAGEAKVVLTGTGEAPQRLVLKPDGDGWAGPAKAAGAPGYVAVVSVALGGHTESGRTSWGALLTVEAAPAPAPAHDAGDADEGHGHGHGHGH